MLLHELATMENAAGNGEQARQIWERSIRIDESIGDVAGAAVCKYMLAQLDAIDGRFERAIELAKQAVQQLEELGYAEAERARDVQGRIMQLAAQATIPKT